MWLGEPKSRRSRAVVYCALVYATTFARPVAAQVVPPSRNLAARPQRFSEDSHRDLRNAIVTRQRLFSIPFAVDEQAKPPREIHLFVSGDRGARWSLYQKRPAKDRKFDFQAGKDGEYWFAVGTDTVRIRPDRNTRPEKIVIVDTDLPRIDLRIAIINQGRLTAQWYAVDDTLSPGTFRLSYRTDALPEWKRINVILPRETSPEFDGEVSWMVNDPGTIYVRAEIMDRAGNVGSIVRDVPEQPAAPAGDYDNHRKSDFDQGLSAGSPLNANATGNNLSWRDSEGQNSNTVAPYNEASPWEPEPLAEAETDLPEPENNGHDRANIAEFVDRRRPLPDAPLGNDATDSDDWRSNRSLKREPVRERTRWTSDGEAAILPRQPEIEEGSSSAGRMASELLNSQKHDLQRQKDFGDRSGFPAAEQDAPRQHPGYANEVDNQYDASPLSADPYANFAEESPTDPPRSADDQDANGGAYDGSHNRNEEADYHDRRVDVQVTNSQEFNLDYDVADLGTGDLARVELWVTKNHGRTWSPYGTDADLQSPFFVEVDGEGTFGFQLLIHSTNGNSTRPPQPGEKPDMSIEVDTSKPSAYLTQAYFPRGRSQMEIEWQATDKNLSANSITLSYAETRNGPWVIIAKDIPNTGKYSWDLPDNLPRTIRLQIDIQDEAGNRTVHQLEEATPTKPANPRARIQGFRPSQ